MKAPSQQDMKSLIFALSSLICTDLSFWKPQMCNCHAAIKSSKILISNVNSILTRCLQKEKCVRKTKSYSPTFWSDFKATCKFNIKFRSRWHFNANYLSEETETQCDDTLCSRNNGIMAARLGALYLMERVLEIHSQEALMLFQASLPSIPQLPGICLLPSSHSPNCFLEDHPWSFKSYTSKSIFWAYPPWPFEQTHILPSALEASFSWSGPVWSLALSPTSSSHPHMRAFPKIVV